MVAEVVEGCWWCGKWIRGYEVQQYAGREVGQVVG